MGIDEEAAQNIIEQVRSLQDALSLLQNEEMTSAWQRTLNSIASAVNTAPVISGYATRLLTEYKILEGDELIKAFYYRMSGTSLPSESAAWLEGFLKGSGSILLVDQDLWGLVNSWVAALKAETFQQVLPLLRRTFAAFSSPERRKLGEKVKSGGASRGIKPMHESDIDEERAMKGIPIVFQLLGLTKTTNTN
jgi:hypothetical protein